MNKAFIIIITLTLSLELYAQDNYASLKDEINVLSSEIAKLKTKKQSPMLFKEMYGLNAGASKVYNIEQGVSIGGYGELLFTAPQGSSIAQSDMYRFVPYIGYKFNDSLIFNAEIEFEHGGSYQGQNEVIVEFAYLDFLNAESLNIRVGHILVPIGLTAVKHEPIYFPSTNRPAIEKYLVPSTWHENGIMLHGNIFENLNYSFGAVNSLDLADSTQLKQEEWIRGGRQRGAKAKSEDLSVFLRADYTFWNSSLLGASVYSGNSSHGSDGIGTATVSIIDLHTILKVDHFTLTGLYLQGELSDTDKITDKLLKVMGAKTEGYYITLQYNASALLGLKKKLSTFVRYSEYDLHKKVLPGQTKNKELDKNYLTFGLNYYPDDKVALKIDYQKRNNDVYSEEDQLNMAFGFIF